ncbi:MAG: peptidoglycan-binding protein [Cyanobacteria bacterium J06636_27]
MTNTIDCPTFKPTLRVGNRGQDVKEMQKRLEKRFASIYPANFQIHVDGIFGSQTESAIKYLQCLAFLEITGITDAATWNFICDGVQSLPILRRNSTGNTVKLLQQTLKDYSFYNGAVNGFFDANTEIAVKAFQDDYALIADGIIGEKGWTTLIHLNTHIDSCYCSYYGGC